MIISFYSYKGGVGRTQLVANIAAFLCYDKKQKVLLIDWDLEAPGLHFYFDKSRVSNIGLIDLFSDYVKQVRGTNNVQEGLPDKDELKKHITNLKTTKSRNGVIDLLPAGKYGDGYSEKINSFDWFNFYNALDGNVFIEYFKRKLAELEYDFILIDSRTGISDYSGICNIQMPVANVIITVPNNQNFIGTKKIIETIEKSPYVKSGYRKPIIFPILSRLDTSVEAESVEWQKKFTRQFSSTINNLSQFIDADLTIGYVKNTLLEYKRDLAFGETILFSELKKLERGHKTLAEPYGNIGEFLTFLKNRLYPHETVISSNVKFNERINRLINKFNISQALSELLEYARLNKYSDMANNIIVLSSRLNSIEVKNQIGIMTSNEYSIQINRIFYSVINILSEIEELDNENSSLGVNQTTELLEIEDLLVEKLNYLWKEHAIVSGGSTKFALIKEIEEVENELSMLRDKLKVRK